MPAGDGPPVPRSPVHPFTRSPVHPLTRSPVHPLTRSPVHPTWRPLCNPPSPDAMRAETAASEANVSNDVDPRGDGLREMAEKADQVARAAEGAREENLRATHRTQETDYDFRLPPDVAEADRVRAADDVELNARQEDMAETQRRAAEALRRSAESLHAGAESLEQASEAVADNRRDVAEIRENLEDLRAQVAQAREQVNETDVPRVDRDDDGGSA